MLPCQVKITDLLDGSTRDTRASILWIGSNTLLRKWLWLLERNIPLKNGAGPTLIISFHAGWEVDLSEAVDFFGGALEIAAFLVVFLSVEALLLEVEAGAEAAAVDMATSA